MVDWDKLDKKKQESIMYNQAVNIAWDMTKALIGTSGLPTEGDMAKVKRSILDDFIGSIPIVLSDLKEAKKDINSPLKLEPMNLDDELE